MSDSETFIVEKAMLDLFRADLEVQLTALNNGLVALEKGDVTNDHLEAMMRAAHSLKGGARVLNLKQVVELAHTLEDFFVALQHGRCPFHESAGDILFSALDAMSGLAKATPEQLFPWLKKEKPTFDHTVKQVRALLNGDKPPEPPKYEALPDKNIEDEIEENERVLRVTAQNLSRLMGLAGESMVESRWLAPFSSTLNRLKKDVSALSSNIEILRESLKEVKVSEVTEKQLHVIQDTTHTCLFELSERITELDLFISRHSSLTDRLYSEVIDSRMRPLADGIEAFSRMVRDMAKELGKQVHFEIRGRNTPVDRDILDKLEAPLNHLIRNAIDHGIETTEEREKKGKNPIGNITLSAEHRGGMLAITIKDDGQGIDLEALRKRIVEKSLIKHELAAKLSKQELLDFLFLPGFSTKDEATDISGRGMGLNVVQNMLQEVSGSIRIIQEEGKGTSFNLHLPLTLSVIRALTVEIGGEPYAFPLARIERSLLVPMEQVEIIENRQYFSFEGVNIGLVTAAEVLEVSKEGPNSRVLPVVVLRDGQNVYGLVVDCFLGERELVLQDLEMRLGKVPDISAGAFMEDGSPALIIDTDDIISSIDNLLTGGRLHQVEYKQENRKGRTQKRVLVIDDSITVREVQSRLLHNHGYEVETAVNGMDGWNAIRMSSYDLVITDVDMPRMNGIELLQMIRSDPSYKNIPVMIVSYKEREQDRVLGMEAGANYYMTKGSFNDHSLIKAVEDLIGTPI